LFHCHCCVRCGRCWNCHGWSNFVVGMRCKEVSNDQQIIE
jgi:hypothetical protein